MMHNDKQTITLIAAVGMRGELGKDNALLWKLKGDLPFFKQKTVGHPVIMGRKTFESLPGALPGRLNLVLTRSKGYSASGAETVSTPEAALSAAAGRTEEVFVIGGGEIYAAFLPFADRLLLTEAFAACPDADTFFPAFDTSEWRRTVLDRGGGLIRYEHVLYERT